MIIKITFFSFFKYAATNDQFLINDQNGDVCLTPEQHDENDPQTKRSYVIDHETMPSHSSSSSM